MSTQVKDLNHLKSRAEEGCEVYIQLNYGAKTSKYIKYYPEDNTFDIHNFVDSSDQLEITESKLETDTIIVKAIKNKSLYIDD